MLSECAGEGLGEFESGKVVAFCDHLGFLGRAYSEHEIRRKAFHIALDLFVQPFCGNTIEFREIRIDNDLLSADEKD
jgi:hypothetical protein